MKEEISTLQELRDVAGSLAVDRIFTEYLMEMVAKSKLLDEIQKVIDKGGSLEDIKELL